MKKIFGSLAILCLLGTGTHVSALEGEDSVKIEASTRAEVRATNPNLPIRADIKANRDTIKAEIQTKRASTTEMRDERKDARASSSEIRKEMRASTTEMRDARKDARASSSEIRKEMRASTTAARKDARRENAEKNIRFHADRMTNRLNAAVNRFEKIMVRLDSRIAKLKTDGKVTTEAEKFQADAKVSIASARTLIATIPTALEEALAQEKLAGSFKDLEKIAVGVRTNLLSAKKSLQSAVASLKIQSTEMGTEPTTSVNTQVQ